MVFAGLPVLLLFFISLGGYLGSETLKCTYNKGYASDGYKSYFYTSAVCGACACFVILFSGFKFEFSLYSVLLGLLFGLAVMGNIAASSMAIRIGPWSYTTVMVSLGIIIPAFSGAIFFDEKLSWLDFLGLALMTVCFFCSVKKEDGEKKSNIRWLLYSVVAMLAIAVVGLLQKTHQSSVHKDEIAVFLTTAFAFSAVASFVIGSLIKRASPSGEGAGEKSDMKVKALIIIGAGAATALNHVINLYLSGAIDSVVFFPVMCGCELIGVTLTSLLLFKERLSLVQWIGLSSGAVAALLLCI